MRASRQVSDIRWAWIEAMNETKKPADLISFQRKNNPGYIRVQYRHQEALWICSLYFSDITKTTKRSPGRTDRAGLHRAVEVVEVQ